MALENYECEPKTSMFNPELGTLVTISVASELTGISKATLRNWRLPEGKMRAKFPCYEGSTNKVWYRLADLDLYLNTFPKQDPKGKYVGSGKFRIIESLNPNAFDAPLQGDI